ncbi:hypothetical protein [Aliiroseovarius crassostreae]|uniref:hypothetical protein n=1 Tax=Aliiroseovarius crassostreae TaxID=154981 RepID=UPI0021FE6C27|nr:hypothetical protein [Aliiroseovarius crassostreae]UWP97799.1 hypothetical protein K3X53_10465 [Aliiroseovarius crassostreae]
MSKAKKMNLNPNPAGIQMPAPSLAERIPPLSSRGHASGHIIVGRGEKRRTVLVESGLEFKWAIVLDADPDVKSIREQVKMEWSDEGEKRVHYFDFLATMRSGQKAALIVKPAKRARSKKFLREAREIAAQVARTGFADETRVLTDECVDPVHLRNARLFRSVCEPDVHADEVAVSLIKNLVGAVSISELTARLELGARGFRATVRLISIGCLEPLHHEVISPATLVKKGGVL